MRILYEYFSKYWLYKNYMCIYFKLISKLILIILSNQRTNITVSNTCRKNYFRVFTLINKNQVKKFFSK